MKKLILAALFATLPLAVASISTSQAADDDACQQAIKKSCTACHGVAKICKKAGEANVNWAGVVANMGKKGNIPQDAQDAVLKCLQGGDAAKLVCDK